MTSTLREIINLIYSAFARLHLEYSLQLWGNQHYTRMWTCWSKFREGPRGMEHLSYKDRLAELGLSNLEKRLWGDLLVPSST